MIVAEVCQKYGESVSSSNQAHPPSFSPVSSSHFGIGQSMNLENNRFLRQQPLLSQDNQTSLLRA